MSHYYNREIKWLDDWYRIKRFKLFYVLYIFMSLIWNDYLNIHNRNHLTEYSNIHRVVEYLFEPYNIQVKVIGEEKFGKISYSQCRRMLNTFWVYSWMLTRKIWRIAHALPDLPIFPLPQFFHLRYSLQLFIKETWFEWTHIQRVHIYILHNISASTFLNF